MKAVNAIQELQSASRLELAALITSILDKATKGELWRTYVS
jgi:hypothetical protein